jgi:hypothetical protein
LNGVNIATLSDTGAIVGQGAGVEVGGIGVGVGGNGVVVGGNGVATDVLHPTKNKRITPVKNTQCENF